MPHAKFNADLIRTGRKSRHTQTHIQLDVAENLGEVSCMECTGQGNNFESVPVVKMETRHTVTVTWRSFGDLQLLQSYGGLN